MFYEFISEAKCHRISTKTTEDSVFHQKKKKMSSLHTRVDTDIISPLILELEEPSEVT